MQGNPEAQQWLTALAQWCEGVTGAAVKQELGELLRCGCRSKDKLVGVANRARQQIANIFRQAGWLLQLLPLSARPKQHRCQDGCAGLWMRAGHACRHLRNVCSKSEQLLLASDCAASRHNMHVDIRPPGWPPHLHPCAACS